MGVTVSREIAKVLFFVIVQQQMTGQWQSLVIPDAYKGPLSPMRSTGN